jgi:beta-galactosidase
MLGESFGYVLYRTALEDPAAGLLEIGEPRDYATIAIDGNVAGALDRRKGTASLHLDARRAGATLDILVENCGRINYGPLIDGERKGLTNVYFNGRELLGWHAFVLPLRDLTPLQFSAGPKVAPAFLRGAFQVERARDTFFDTRGLGKGVLFLNGRNLGRYWSAGPQASLYVPGAWLRRGRNEAVVFETEGALEPYLRGANGPLIRSL